ncbi:MAG: hypothetical protein IJJ86_06460 [Clostridia bacterium]|nr:hypothetical protein [Clostridia bacterium]
MLFKKLKLERQLMEEIKRYANVTEFPPSDARVIADFLNAYNRGNAFIMLTGPSAVGTLEKYPSLYRNWDNLMIKYKKLGLFPNWSVSIDE